MIATTETPTSPKHQYVGNQLRILELLGSGLSPEIVATAAGVTPSYISQLLSEESFATEVTALRFKSLQSATERDNKYDSLEERLLDKMADLLPTMYKSHEVLKALAVVNAAKRRGAAAPEQTTINNTVINLALPKHLISAFKVDINNQVVEASIGAETQTLVTMPSASLLHKIKTRNQPNDLAKLPDSTKKSAPTASS
jgi:hypothetical protein